MQCGRWVPTYQIVLLYRRKIDVCSYDSFFLHLNVQDIMWLVFLLGIAEISHSDKALDTSVCLATSVLHAVLPIFSLRFLDAL